MDADFTDGRNGGDDGGWRTLRLASMARAAEEPDGGVALTPLPAGSAPARPPLAGPPDMVVLADTHWRDVGRMPRFVAELSDAVVHPQGGLLEGAGGTLFWDALPAPHRVLDLGVEVPVPLPVPPDYQAAVALPGRLQAIPARAKLPPPARRIPGAAVMLGLQWDYNYYHWLVEVLPRLALVADHRLPLLLFGRPSAFQSRTLERLGIATGRQIWLTEPVQVERLLFPSRLFHPAFPEAEAATWLRRRFVGPMTRLRTRLSRPRRLFVSRANAPSRQLGNEAELLEALRPHGFEAVDPGSLDFDSQVALFAGAEAIAGPHGAGFTNMVFARRGAAVLEILAPTHPIPCYWALAAACGHRHACIGTSTDGRHADPDALVRAWRTLDR